MTEQQYGYVVCKVQNIYYLSLYEKFANPWLNSSYHTYHLVLLGSGRVTVTTKETIGSRGYTTVNTTDFFLRFPKQKSSAFLKI